MTFEQHVQAALSRHENGFNALPSVLAALEALAKERLEQVNAKDERGMYLPTAALNVAAPVGWRQALGRAVYGGVNAVYSGGNNVSKRATAWIPGAPEPRSVSHWGMFA